MAYVLLRNSTFKVSFRLDALTLKNENILQGQIDINQNKCLCYICVLHDDVELNSKHQLPVCRQWETRPLQQEPLSLTQSAWNYFLMVLTNKWTWYSKLNSI